MEAYLILLTFVSVIVFIIGLSQFIGTEWAIFIANLLSSTPSYPDASSKKVKGSKYLGIFLITLSLLIVYYVGSKA